MAAPLEPVDLVNLTGYPLQIALAHEVQTRSSAHGWRVLYQEHSWSNGTDRTQGFVDLVLEHANMQVVLILECKRLVEKDWVFLPMDGDAQPRRTARAFHVARRADDAPIGVGWDNRPADPRSPQVAFAVTSKDSRERSIDGLAAELVSATEAVAHEEMETYLPHRGGHFRRLYYPVIVTTARLSVCSFDPSDITLDTGQLPPGILHQSYSVLRYTKQLSTQKVAISNDLPFGSEASALADAKARNVFIVAADRLDGFLCDFEVDDRER